ncbi:MAG: hypothetical protein WAV40_03985 [Microgenomates group bacterium]
MLEIKTNLLKNRKSLSEKDYQKERNYLRMSIVSLVLVVVIVMALSIWNLVLSTKLKTITTSLTAMNQEMQGLTEASAQQIYLKSRLNLLSGFLSSRSDARKSLERVLSTDIPGTHISQLAFVDDTTLGVSYVANSPTYLKDLLSYYETDTGYFAQVVNKGISRSQDNTYQISLLLALPKGAK